MRTNLGEELEKKYPEYVTTGAVAKYCGVSTVTVLRWIERGYMPAFRLPEGHYRIHKDDFGKFLTKHSIPLRKQLFKENRGGRAND